MVGDTDDMARRLLAVLPTRWFGDNSSLLRSVLTGVGTAWSAAYQLLQYVIQQARIETSSGLFLDLAAADFLGARLTRRPGESDVSLRLRIEQEMLRPRATRAALTLGLSELTGHTPQIFEPARPADTGGYSAGGVGFGVAGGWGSLELPFQSFVTAFRPSGGGISTIAGYGTGGPLAYGNLSQVQSPVSDEDIYATVSQLVPAACIAWVRIKN